MTAVKISVAMCTFNGDRHLGEQLASIGAQDRLPDELVVCDDRSTDATPDIVREFASSAPFAVRFHVNEHNLGSTKNFERAIGLCQGDLIALSDHDDVWLPEKLRRIEERFAEEPQAGLVFSDAEVVGEDLQPLGYRLWESVGFDGANRRLVREGRALDVLLPGWTVTGATLAFRAQFKNLVLEIPTDLTMIHDGWIALIIASVAEVSFIEDPLVKYRQHSRQQIGAREHIPDEGAGTAALAVVKEAMKRRNSYGELIESGSCARRRLAERSDEYGVDAALARLDDRLTHLRARASLPDASVNGRVRCVLRELVSQRYSRYSNGVYSAVKDLLG